MIHTLKEIGVNPILVNYSSDLEGIICVRQYHKDSNVFVDSFQIRIALLEQEGLLNNLKEGMLKLFKVFFDYVIQPKVSESDSILSKELGTLYNLQCHFSLLCGTDEQGIPDPDNPDNPFYKIGISTIDLNDEIYTFTTSGINIPNIVADKLMQNLKESNLQTLFSISNPIGLSGTQKSVKSILHNCFIQWVKSRFDKYTELHRGVLNTLEYLNSKKELSVKDPKPITTITKPIVVKDKVKQTKSFISTKLLNS